MSEARKILKQYAFSLVVILCAGFFLLGAIRVKEKTQYNMDMTLSETVKTEKSEDGITFYYKDKRYIVRTDYAEKIREAAEEGLIFDFRHIFN